jgi:ClpP class serine protease
VQSALVAKRIRDLAAEKKLPVLAFVEDVAASGGYWLACAADEIIADYSSVVGSIGVISAGFGFPELIRRYGIERRVHAVGRHKAMLDPFQPEDPDDVERLKSLQVDIFEGFAAYVRERRAGRLKAPESELFTGAFWTGRRAVELGLVDGLGDLRSVLRARYGEKVRLVPIRETRSWLGRWRRGGGAGRASGDAWGRDVAGAALAAVEERLLWARFGL